MRALWWSFFHYGWRCLSYRRVRVVHQIEIIYPFICCYMNNERQRSADVLFLLLGMIKWEQECPCTATRWQSILFWILFHLRATSMAKGKSEVFPWIAMYYQPVLIIKYSLIYIVKYVYCFHCYYNIYSNTICDIFKFFSSQYYTKYNHFILRK